MMSMFGVMEHPAIIQAGALDGLKDNDFRDLVPRDEQHPLVTRVSGGREVVVAKDRIIPLLRTAVARTREHGASVVCVLCTGVFPSLADECLIVYPDHVLRGAVNAVLPSGRLGVLMPHPRQERMMHEKWQTETRAVITAASSPYHECDDLDAAARTFKVERVDAIVMDCIGFDREMQRHLRNLSSVPVLLASGVVGSLLNELVDMSL
jgi:protein AroM